MKLSSENYFKICHIFWNNKPQIVFFSDECCVLFQKLKKTLIQLLPLRCDSATTRTHFLLHNIVHFQSTVRRRPEIGWDEKISKVGTIIFNTAQQASILK